jgi:23S rRNA (uracil1939-C5)-methyltransferase
VLQWDDNQLVFPLTGFFQSNTEMFRRLCHHVLDGWTGETFLDLYSGVGVFASLARKNFQRVVCVEQETRAIGFAKRNVGEANAFFHPMESESFAHLPSETQGLPPGIERFSDILVDPPRTGLSPFLKKWLASQSPRRLAYVSCNPVTFARDLKDLTAAGMRLQSVRGFDFYPQTSHLECLAILDGSAQVRSVLQGT